MHMYIYMHTYRHICVHMHAYKRICGHMYTYRHIYVLYVYIYMYIRSNEDDRRLAIQTADKRRVRNQGSSHAQPRNVAQVLPVQPEHNTLPARHKQIHFKRIIITLSEHVQLQLPLPYSFLPLLSNTWLYEFHYFHC